MPNSTRGFASLSKAKRQAVSRQAGKLAHVKGRAHTWTSQEASAAGIKSGLKRKSPGIPDLKAGKR